MLLAGNNTDTASVVQSENANMREEIGRALGRLASGVYVVTLETESGPHGMLATWVAQAGFDPPTVTVAINKQRHILEGLQGKTITINTLSKSNMDIFKAFARPSTAALDDRFDAIELAPNSDGGPMFAKAVSALNCQVHQVVDVGDHALAIARVLSGKTLNLDAEPMVHLRKNGFQY